MCFKLFWYKVFIHWKLKLLDFLVDSILTKPQIDWIRSICCNPLPIAYPISSIHNFVQIGLQILYIDFLPTAHPSHGFGTTNYDLKENFHVSLIIWNLLLQHAICNFIIHETAPFSKSQSNDFGFSKTISFVVIFRWETWNCTEAELNYKTFALVYLIFIDRW